MFVKCAGNLTTWKGTHTPPPAARYIGSVSIYWCLYSLKLVYCSIVL